MMRRWLVLVVAMSVALAGEAPDEFPKGTLRDPAWWPFASDSPWNVPLGSEAVYAAPTSPLWKETIDLVGVMINTTAYSHPIFFAKADDPVRWFHEGGQQKRQARVPDHARSNDDGDAAMHIIDERRAFVTETLVAKRRGDLGIDTVLTNAIDLRGPGVFPTYSGACAYGGSTIAGVIRQGELRHGIRHALRISLRPQVLNPNAPTGKGHVWPANSNEPGYSGTGNLYMGSLLAIPPDVDLVRVAGPVGSAGWHLAKALQDYGAYVVDRGHLNFYAEPTANDEVALVSATVRREIAKVLHVVTNNAPDRIGGGGVRRRQLAPPVLPPGQAAPDPTPTTIGGVLIPQRSVAKKVPTQVRRTVVVREPPTATVLAPWDERLRARLHHALDAKQEIRFTFAQTGTVMQIVAFTDDQLSLTSNDGALTVPWALMRLSDRISMALDLARSQDLDDVQLAAFFHLANGQDDAARPLLTRLKPEQITAIDAALGRR
jgi:hypothetical protein